MTLPLHQSLVPLTLLVSIVGLTVNSPTHRYASFVLILGLFASVVHHGMPLAEQPTAVVLSVHFFAMSNFLALSNPHELRMFDQTQPTDELSVFARIRWAVMLLVSPRLVGWTVEPTTALPPRSRRTSRLLFAAEQLAYLTFNMVVMNITTISIDRTPEFQLNGPKLSDAPWVSRSIHGLKFALATSSGMKVIHQSWILALLATGRWSPSDFSPFFGTWGNAYTLRKFWGRTWHQLLRHMLTTHARFVSQKLLGLPRHSKVRTYLELYLAFFVSGLLHYSLEYMTIKNWANGAIQFFTLQAVAIHLEDVVIAFASSRLGLKQNKMWKVIGYIWVVQWFGWSLPMWLEPRISGGAVDNVPRVRVVETVCLYALERCPLA